MIDITSDEALGRSFWRHQATRWLARLGGAIAFLLWMWLSGWPGQIVATDSRQHRLDTALPPLDQTVTIEQSFRAHHDGLSEIELLVARHGEPGDAILMLELLDPAGQRLAEQPVPTASLRHNEPLRFRFQPLERSAGASYVLRLTANGPTRLSVWGYSLQSDERDQLRLSGASTGAEALRLEARYQLSPAGAVSALVARWRGPGALLPLLLLFLLMPGALLLALRPRWSAGLDSAASWGLSLALGCALWPLLWWGGTLAGARWTGPALWAVMTVGWLSVLLLWVAGGRRARSPVVRWHREHGVLLLILLGGLAARLLAVRDLLFPPWVDSVRHALIISVMMASGQTPSGYAPFLPVDSFPYHFGFHTIAASLLLMTGWSLPDTLLWLGQLLNVLIGLSIYAAAWLMTRRRSVGLAAAFLVSFPFLFPGYYVTWGRFTQLTAMIVLPLLIALTWLLVRGSFRWRGAWSATALLAAGLFLIHARVFIFYLPWPLLLWLGSRGRGWRWLAAAGALGGTLVAPRVLTLLAHQSSEYSLTGAIEGYNAFPTGYLVAGWERYSAAAGVLALIMALVAWVQRRRWAALPLALAGWVILLFASLAGPLVGLPESGLINLNSLYITLFLPLSVVLSVVAERLWRWSRTESLPVGMLRHALLGLTLTALLCFGFRQQITILNSQTILAERADRAGLEWIAENLPPEAYVAVNSWKWLGTTWAGSDGGAWLLPLTGRQSTTPPADYMYSVALHERVDEFNRQAEAIESWDPPSAAAWLREQGVTHIYAGARGGFFDPAELARNPELKLLYRQDGVFIFEVLDE